MDNACDNLEAHFKVWRSSSKVRRNYLFRCWVFPQNMKLFSTGCWQHWQHFLQSLSWWQTPMSWHMSESIDMMRGWCIKIGNCNAADCCLELLSGILSSINMKATFRFPNLVLFCIFPSSKDCTNKQGGIRTPEQI